MIKEHTNTYNITNYSGVVINDLPNGFSAKGFINCQINTANMWIERQAFGNSQVDLIISNYLGASVSGTISITTRWIEL